MPFSHKKIPALAWKSEASNCPKPSSLATKKTPKCHTLFYTTYRVIENVSKLLGIVVLVDQATS